MATMFPIQALSASDGIIPNAIHWLVSPQAAFVTGQVIPVNGGFRPA